ncbi:MAG: serine/threonine-protein kinase, partial [Gemmataceae bacterium]
MAKSPASEFVAAVRQSQVLEPDQLDELAALAAKVNDPRELARQAMKHNWLTPYQVNQISLGKGSDLVLGQYLLLERLGEGGMGQVFKARQRRLDRIVALKIIRKEKLDNPKAVDRFKREIRAAGKLSHVNIVMAFDADQVGQTHFFAMEYVPGIDLSRLVKEHGPFPLEAAVEYTRQAALGLQHAFERGLVHRDIKPANLLITPPPARTDRGIRWGGQLKILDMGLARLNENRSEDELASRLTQEGTVMGTPDFIAPEQAMNSNTADIRADLYSLGCTFYFILTGKVPFPGGTMMEKIIRHRSEPFVPIELLRADLPKSIVAVINRLLTKKPEDRYQTPAELADALQAAMRGGPTQAPGAEPTLVSATGLLEATSI